jgi:hypothetical protein
MILRAGFGLWAALSLAILAGLQLKENIVTIIFVIAYILILIGIFFGDAIDKRINS